MSRQTEFDRYVELGKVACRHVATAADRLGRKSAALVVQGVRIAAPILRGAARRSVAELRRQAVAAKPVTYQAVQATTRVAQHAVRTMSTVLRNGVAHAVHGFRNLIRQHLSAGKIGLVGAAGVCAVLLMAGFAVNRISGERLAVDTPAMTQPPTADTDPMVTPAVEPSPEQTSEVFPPSSTPPARPDVLAQQQQQHQQQRYFELEQRRQQARLELEQAAADYDYAVEQWNAEVAACQQSGPPAGYTPQQMGRLAAMGYRPQTQPRQPNQAILYAARQAEQRFLQARNRWQQISQQQ